MLDVTQLAEADLNKLYSIHARRLSRYFKPTCKLSARKLSKLRQFLKKECAAQFSGLSAEVQEYLKSCSDTEFFAFLDECIKERVRRYRAEEDRVLAKVAVFGEKVHFAAGELASGHLFSTIEYRDGAVTVTIDEGAFFICLTLQGVTEFCENFKIENALWTKLDYDEDKKEYFFEAEMERDGELKSTFTDAEAEFVPYNPLFTYSVKDAPWTFLSRVCSVILIKADSAPELLNDKEKELLPLIREVSNLVFVKENSSFQTLRVLAKKHGLCGTEKLLEKYEKTPLDRTNSIRTKLLRKMNRISHVEMWREIYDMINEAESDYPTPTECSLDPSEVSAVRERATKILYDRGYSGVYPCFTKPLKPRKFLCFESYGETYFALFEKKIQARVCFFETAGGTPLLFVNSGTVFFRKNESVDDYFSFAFNARGRRYFAGSRFTDFKSDNDDLEKIITIAAKKAELKKLTKDERAHSSVKGIFPWWFIPVSIIFGGGFFFVGMGLISMLASFIVIALGWTTVTFADFVATFPWLELAVLSLLGFGGTFGLIMAIINYFAMKK